MSGDNSGEDGDFADADRRSVLKGLAAAGTTGLLGVSSVDGVAAQQEPISRSNGVNSNVYLTDHIERRQEAASRNETEQVNDISGGDNPPGTRNADEETIYEGGGRRRSFETRPFVFTKGMTDVNPYVPDSLVTTSRHKQLDEVLVALNEGKRLGNEDEFPTPSDVPGDTRRPLIAMPSAVSLTTEGTDAFLPSLPEAPAYDGGRTTVELLEAYAMSQLRDEPLDTIESASLLQDLRTDFNRVLDDADLEDYAGHDFGWFQGFDADGSFAGSESGVAENVFRDPIYGCDVGPYGSQIWYDDVPLGGIEFPLQVRPITGVKGTDGRAPELTELDTSGPPFCTTESAVLENIRQRSGAEPGHDEDYRVDLERGEAVYPYRGIDFASQVRDDPAYQPYLLAALQLSSWRAPANPENPYVRNSDQADVDGVHPYIDFGAVGVLDLIARVCRNALIAAWHQKWFVHRRLRPETYGLRIHEDRDYGLPDLLDPGAWQGSEVIGTVQDEHGTPLLPQVYPEGGPAHPAYPSGHSVIAGACAAVLKTHFADISLDELANANPALGGESNRYFDGPKIPDPSNPQEVDDYTASDASDMTVHGEINKFASNIGMARIWAGVHYRSDHLYGMLLGEQVAAATMWDHYTRNTETFGGGRYPAGVGLQVYPHFDAGAGSHPISKPASRELRDNSFSERQQFTMSQPI